MRVVCAPTYCWHAITHRSHRRATRQCDPGRLFILARTCALGRLVKVSGLGGRHPCDIVHSDSVRALCLTPEPRLQAGLARSRALTACIGAWCTNSPDNSASIYNLVIKNGERVSLRGASRHIALLCCGDMSSGTAAAGGGTGKRPPSLPPLRPQRS